MTVTYTADVSTSRGFSTFLILLARWRGSIYKIVWMDLLLFMAIYMLLAACYRYLLDKQSQRGFEALVVYCSSYGNLIPLSFVLGFYVTIVMGRWWAQYTTIPWPDSIATLISGHIIGFTDRSRAMRRTIVRYVCLCQVIVFTMISPHVKLRFPNYDRIIEAGFLLENEKIIIEKLDVAFPNYPKHWMPIVWAASIVMRARREGKIRDDYSVKAIIDELNAFRGMCGFLLYYDWVSVPLVYTQVVTLATYAFFLCTAFGHQWTMDPKNSLKGNDFVKNFPFLVLLQFFFYMGWLKVAEVLINPFGDDDDDFNLNWMIDRNLTVSYLIVDEMHSEHPELVKDQYWDEVFPNELPYANETQRTAPPEASTAKVEPGKSKNPTRANSINFYGGIVPRMRRSSSDFQPPLRIIKLGPESSKASIKDTQAKKTDEAQICVEPLASVEQMQATQPNEMNFEELKAKRSQERRERYRNRLREMRNASRVPPANEQVPQTGSVQPSTSGDLEEEEDEHVI